MSGAARILWAAAGSSARWLADWYLWGTASLLDFAQYCEERAQGGESDDEARS
ncbi:hypothetical protein [Methylobacterium dankookense]|uniref:Uncharacterized protein n=1 Tax=Methylobacterium dankookense TaxID=560405 RepID=A0A564G547_9HYPH|nr:hypothetical protein [Methylobacterium dankookense]GJD58127.1 hypothetical protein IFDJLNFL_4042 [Methylobacterium dankookense]VUF15078.1 hypothetical protein MTDSW087_04811 [Methylobacterium dankookense]